MISKGFKEMGALLLVLASIVNAILVITDSPIYQAVN